MLYLIPLDVTNQVIRRSFDDAIESILLTAGVEIAPIFTKRGPAVTERELAILEENLGFTVIGRTFTFQHGPSEVQVLDVRWGKKGSGEASPTVLGGIEYHGDAEVLDSLYGETLHWASQLLDPEGTSESPQVVLIDGNGCSISPDRTKDACLIVYIYSSPSASANVPGPDYVFGMPMPPGSRVFAPSGVGVPVLDSSGFTVAELVDGTHLYILVPLELEVPDYGPEILEMVVQDVMRNIYFAARNGVEEYLKRRQEQNISASRRATMSDLMKEASEHYRREIESRRTNYRLALQKTQDLQKQIFEKTRRVHYAKAQLKALEEVESQLEEVVSRDVDHILSMDRVRDVAAFGDYFFVYTDPILTPSKNKGLVDIGEFRIEFVITDEHTSVKFLGSLPIKVEGERGKEWMQGPHIDGLGLPLNKEMYLEILRWLQERNLPAAIRVAMWFLESASDARYEKLLSLWASK